MQTGTVVDAPATRDIPVAPRRTRLGLGADLPSPEVSTTEIPVTDDDVAELPVAAVRDTVPAGKHRLMAPPSALKARTALVAIAAGAGAMAFVTSGVDQTSTAASDVPEPATAAPALAANAGGTGPGVAPAESESDLSGFADQLKTGTSLAKAKAAADAAARRPLVVSPIPLGDYDLTSAFAPRWGAFHGGIDMAAPLGTPIHAATDGVVVKSGPASGYGHWVQIKAPDGSITMYGHMADSGVLVHEGQRVTAGDVIALVGSEGFSTGPHLHFEKWIQKGGQYVKVDPAPWLAKEGVKLAALTG